VPAFLTWSGRKRQPTSFPTQDLSGPGTLLTYQRTGSESQVRYRGRAQPVYVAESRDTHRLLAIEGRPDRNGKVWCRIKDIRPHTDYLLKFDAYRPRFTNGVYLEVEIFGQRHLINQHFSYGRVQPIFLKVNSDNTCGTTRLMFQNPHPEVLAFGSPSFQQVAPETITKRPARFQCVCPTFSRWGCTLPSRKI